MTELEKLRRRLRSWADCQGPPWLLMQKGKAVAELKREIAELEAEERARARHHG